MNLDETGGFTDTGLSPYDMNKSKLTNADLTLDNEINQRFAATMGNTNITNLNGTNMVNQKMEEENNAQTFIDGSFSNNLG